MKAVRCICGGHALIGECRGKVTSIVCDKCRYRIPINSENAESKINQLEKAILKWNEDQSRRREERGAEMTEPKLCPMKRNLAENVSHLQQIWIMMETLLATDLNDTMESELSRRCDGPLCAWWNAERKCCGVVAGR